MTESDISLYQEIVDHLDGTCQNLHSILALFERLDLQDNLEFLQYLDDQIMNCDSCGWWVDSEDIEEHDFLGSACSQCIQEWEEMEGD